MKKKITVAFVTQKGGCTKSTTTLITANLLQYKFGKKIAVVDYDSQNTISEIRHEEKELANTYPAVANALTEQGIKVYDVLPANLINYSVSEIAGLFPEDTDYIFFDYPAMAIKNNSDGDTDSEDNPLKQTREKLLSDFREIDVMIVPMTDSDTDNRATLRFLLELNMIHNIEPKLLCVFHTKVDRQLKNWREKLSAEQEKYNSLGFVEVFNTFIPNLKIFNSGMSVENIEKNKINCIRNTILLPNQADLEKSNYLAFTEEFLQKTANIN